VILVAIHSQDVFPFFALNFFFFLRPVFFPSPQTSHFRRENFPPELEIPVSPSTQARLFPLSHHHPKDFSSSLSNAKEETGSPEVMVRSRRLDL